MCFLVLWKKVMTTRIPDMQTVATATYPNFGPSRSRDSSDMCYHGFPFVITLYDLSACVMGLMLGMVTFIFDIL